MQATWSRADQSLAERFAAPPAGSRILRIVHGLPDAPAEQDRLLEGLVANGFGGMVTNVSFTNYLESEERWQAFLRGVEEAKKAGLALWLYDERGYPSGNAGGITMRGHPEWEARGLYVADVESQGGPVALDLPPGTCVQVAAFPVRDGVMQIQEGVDLAQHVHDNKLSWDAPKGAWHVMAITEDRLYEGTHAAVSLADKLPYINLLMPEPTARFIEVTHAAYAKRFGDDLGRYFVATFTDEPSLMSLFMRRQPYRVLPWSPNLPVEFEKRRGYPLLPKIPALIAEAGPAGQRARYDYWLTVGELVSENFFGQIQTWCRQHHTLSGGHLLCEESFLGHVPLYGDFFRCARRLDAPSIDCLTSIPSEVPWSIARLLSSVAELEGRTVTMCETSDHCQRYRPAGDARPVRDVTEAEIRGTCNRLMLNGITTITSYYSFTGLAKEQLVRLNEWVGRCCTALEGGHQVADIAVVYPIESAWPHFEPSRNWVEDAPAAAHQIERSFRTAGDSLYHAARDFTYVDARALETAEPRDGTLAHGKLDWRLVILPAVDTLPLKAWENLAAFWRKGGAVIALTALPANSEHEFPAPRVQALSKEIFGNLQPGQFAVNGAGGVAAYLPAGSEVLLTRVVDAVLEPDARTTPRNAPIRVTHRRIDGQEVYFVINDSDKEWEGAIALSANGPGEQWNPANGQHTPQVSADDVALRLEAYGGMLFRFPSARVPRKIDAKPGAVPGLQSTALPEAAPVVHGGEFVQADLAADPMGPEKGWRAHGKLTKGQVDTFLFASFDYPRPANLAGTRYITIDVRIPEQQKTGTSLLMILRDKNGGEYLANTGLTLNSPGSCRLYVSMQEFQRAGWNRGPDLPLDLTNITTLNIGWGGYLGREGEEIAFSLAAPRMVKD